MQNKGFVKVFAILLTLVCVFYLSFSFVTRYYTNKAKEYAKGDVKLEQNYLDSLSNEKVWLKNYTLKQCREMEISLGLDLKGGMNVILEVSVADVVKALATTNKTKLSTKRWHQLQSYRQPVKMTSLLRLLRSIANWHQTQNSQNYLLHSN
jgi:SecD/SecF fusion protein